MYFALMGKLNARRKNLAQDTDKGFTLIELLVVVIIIGILAAIAIPVYLGVQNNAKDSAVKSDLTNVKTAMTSFYTTNQTYPTAAQLSTTGLASYGYSGTSVDYSKNGASAPAYSGTAPSGSATSFCVVATSPTANKFYVTDSSGVTDTKPSGC